MFKSILAVLMGLAPALALAAQPAPTSKHEKLRDASRLLCEKGLEAGPADIGVRLVQAGKTMDKMCGCVADNLVTLFVSSPSGVVVTTVKEMEAFPHGARATQLAALVDEVMTICLHED